MFAGKGLQLKGGDAFLKYENSSVNLSCSERRKFQARKDGGI